MTLPLSFLRSPSMVLPSTGAVVLSSPQSWQRGQTEGGARSHGRLPLAKADSRGTGEGKARDRESFHGNKPSKTSGGENDANNPRGRGHPAIAPESSR